MEEQKGIVYVIIACSVILVVLGIGFVLFIIQQRRKRHTYESIIEISKTLNDERIEKLEAENKVIHKKLNELAERVNQRAN